jgi:two-component system, sensor histidine kinase and response regulator
MRSDDLNAEAANRTVDLRIGELPDAVGDPVLLRRVFANLLSNAFKFTRRKEQPVVELDGRDEGTEHVYCVRDNGAGFDMRHADHLFRAFHRLHPANDFEGTGVGLSLVQRIVQRHGGRIWAEGAVNLFHIAKPWLHRAVRNYGEVIR